ncbi:Fe-S cluster assembly sulfur transfer protein SufU [Rarobacter incanus]|uniref:Nitrogen fixation NifU-like protein n=1 Tax=Rarobacter incanus TaxID=153494 RepID=A0A542SNJ7_9MICO|nr:SUF system NifU family Fe-S cluster assembly protein [Rarobacter incanus]TQK75827.1 nitrogen fixation NifU-like protein [Rarobacter incanus]
MSADLQNLYQQIILDHARSPHGRGLVDYDGAESTGQSHQVNPTCGDEVTLRVALRGDGKDAVIESISWQGQGCSISQASLSVMTDLVQGSTVAQAYGVAGDFRALMDSRGRDAGDDLLDRLDDAAAFAGVSKFPARIKCALLGWAALRGAIVAATTDSEGFEENE